jgi:hypothetical protein
MRIAQATSSAEPFPSACSLAHLPLLVAETGKMVVSARMALLIVVSAVRPAASIVSPTFHIIEHYYIYPGNDWMGR